MARPNQLATRDAGHARLWGWFGLSYASFLVLPRVLMHEMPDEWQGRMAELLEEYEGAFPNQDGIGTRVLATRDRKLVRWPSWFLNYRYPDYSAVNRCRGEQT